MKIPRIINNALGIILCLLGIVAAFEAENKAEIATLGMLVWIVLELMILRKDSE